MRGMVCIITQGRRQGGEGGGGCFGCQSTPIKHFDRGSQLARERDRNRRTADHMCNSAHAAHSGKGCSEQAGITCTYYTCRYCATALEYFCLVIGHFAMKSIVPGGLWPVRATSLPFHCRAALRQTSADSAQHMICMALHMFC